MKNSIKAIVSILSLFTLSAITFAQTTTEVVSVEQTEHASVTVGAESQYVFRGQIQSGAVATANVTVNTPRETFVSVTGYSGLTSDNKKGINEVDATFGIDHKIDSTAHVLAGFTVYAYPQAATNRTYEAYLGLTYDAFLNPTVIGYWDWTRQNLSVEASIHQDVKVPFIKNLSIRPAAYIGNNHTVRTTPEASKNVSNSCYYGTATADLVYKIGKHVEVSFGGRYNYLDDSVTSKKAWYGGTISATF